MLIRSAFLWVRVGLLSREDGTDTLSRNVGKQLPHDAAQYPRRVQILFNNIHCFGFILIYTLFWELTVNCDYQYDFLLYRVAHKPPYATDNMSVEIYRHSSYIYRLYEMFNVSLFYFDTLS
jgi:hypothetical protein